MEFAGRLASFSPTNLLQWASNERRSGVLVVRRTRRERRVSFRDGRIVGCRSNLIQETFGRHLLDHGLVRADTLARALAHTRLRAVPTGQALVDLDLLPVSVVRHQLTAWISASVRDLCQWRHGVFVFHEHAVAELPLEVAIDAAGLVLEAAYDSDNFEGLRARFPDDGVLLCRGPEWPGEDLEAYDEHIAQGVESIVPLAAVRGFVGGVDLPFLEALNRLVEEGVLEIAGHAKIDSPESRDIDLSEILSADESELAAAAGRVRHVLLPHDVLERLVPVWLHRPATEEIERLSPSLREFVARVDGRARLGEMLDSDQDQATDQADLLFMLLERGSVAFLPGPIESSGGADAVASALRSAGIRVTGQQPIARATKT